MPVVNSSITSAGWTAPDFMLPATDDNTYLLTDFKDKQGLLIIFTCNDCSFAKAHWPIYIDLFHRFKDEIVFIAINPNDETISPSDSFTQMKQRSMDWKIPFPYLWDKTQEISSKYDAKSTPECYLFKRDGSELKLFYRGLTIDNWENPELAKKFYLQDAIMAMLKGQEPPLDQPAAVGCSIKWR